MAADRTGDCRSRSGLDVTIVLSENTATSDSPLPMNRSGREFGNEFRYRTDGNIMTPP